MAWDSHPESFFENDCRNSPNSRHGRRPPFLARGTSRKKTNASWIQLYYMERFGRSHADAPLRAQKQCDKQLGLLRRTSVIRRCEPGTTTRRSTSILGMEFLEVGDFSPDVHCCTAMGITGCRKTQNAFIPRLERWRGIWPKRPSTYCTANRFIGIPVRVEGRTSQV